MLAFLTQVVKEYHTTGAIMPSSPALANAMTATLHRHKHTKRVLEVGPGTGVFTKRILTALQPGDTCDIVEINDAFVANLEESLLRSYRQAHPDVTLRLHNAPIETAPVEGPYDSIICGLPFNNFPLSQVSLIFRRMLSLLAEGGELHYFEYVGMKALKWPWVGTRGRARLRRRIALERVLERRCDGTRDIVVRNITPARKFRLLG